MEERRNTSRAKVAQLLSVFDRSNEEMLGNLVDISVQGLLLFSRKVIAVDTVWHLSIGLPAEVNGSSTIWFGAESLWRHEIGEPPNYWTGFQIIDLASVEREKIVQLIE
jgi:PilZ domain